MFAWWEFIQIYTSDLCISLCVLYFNKNGKKKIHVISSVDTKKALDKVQYPFMIKETRSRRKIP